MNGSQPLRSPALAAAVIGAFALLPLTPSFIAVTSIVPPGVSVVPVVPAVALFGFDVAVGVAAFVVLVRCRPAAPPTFRPYLWYLGALALASVVGFDPRTGLSLVFLGGIVLVWQYALWTLVDWRPVIQAIYATILAGGTLASLVALVLVVLRRPPELYTFAHGRAVGTFIVPGELAGYLLFILATALGVALVARSRWLRLLAYAALGTGLAALALSFSRAGWFGFAVGAAVFVAARRGSRRLAVAGGIVVLLIAIGLPFYGGHHNETDNFSRIGIWRTALRTIALFPVTGVGPGGFRLVYPLLRPPEAVPAAFHAHDYLLTTAAETGLVGIAALALVWWRFVGALLERLARAQPAARTLALALAAGFAATWAQGLLDSVEVVEFPCWIPFMALALGAAEFGLDGP